jgi:glycosyltransferase A (GT-A) superfamily protein (DUF2064 family)
VDLIVLAKEPVAGRVKTRLTPPCTPEEAATLAAAALTDTLAAGLASAADRVVLGLDGRAAEWCPPGVTVVDQGHGALSARLETVWSHVEGPALQIGMDTPQVTAPLIDEALARLDRPDTDAVLGLAEDGGWWGIGLRRPIRGCFTGIATSQPDTGARQLARLRSLGLRTTPLPVLRDVDQWADAVAVAPLRPESAFAWAVRRVAARIGLSSVGRHTRVVPTVPLASSR